MQTQRAIQSPISSKTKRKRQLLRIYFFWHSWDCRKSKYKYYWIDPATGELGAQLYCKRWQCSFCGKRKKQAFEKQVNLLIAQVPFVTYITLTLNHSNHTAANSVKTIQKFWRSMQVSLAREFGKGKNKYLRVLEFQESGHAHLHILLNQIVDEKWVKRSWKGVGGGSQVDCKPITHIGGLGHYLAAELTKGYVPKGTRRFSKSKGIQINLSFQKNVDLKSELKEKSNRWAIISEANENAPVAKISH